MNTILLKGCRTQPLASYLKGLGILRLLARQVDATAKMGWEDDQVVLTTRLSLDELLAWFLDSYSPTPITSPWNGGSGYFPNDKSARKALETIESATNPRFELYRLTMADCRAALKRQGLEDKPEGDAKIKFVSHLRSNLRVEEALEWLDAACVVGDDRLEMVPLLGTGGNDGRLDFSSNFAQNIVNLLLSGPKQRGKTESLLRQALLEEPCKGLENTAIGQYAPGNAGGPNTTSGFDGSPNVNPWDFVLALEGSLVFSAAATRRLGDGSQGFSLPFTVDPSMGGHSAISADEGDKARCEMWLPTWGRPLSYPELRMIFSEGRAQTGRRQAANGVDFARAVASLGVERGLTSFERFTFLVRNGKNYFATPAGKYRVRGDQGRAVDCLQELDPWLRRYRRKAEQNGGSAIRSLFHQLDNAILDLCRQSGADLLTVLRILGRIERQLSNTPKIQNSGQPEQYVAPLPHLSVRWWPEAGDCSEVRLAMSLRGLAQIREFVEPTNGREWLPESRNAVWSKDSISRNLVKVLKRRFLYEPYRDRESLVGLRLQQWRFTSSTAAPVRAVDLERFVYGQLDERLLDSTFFGLLLVETPSGGFRSEPLRDVSRLPFAYCAAKIAFAGADPRTSSSDSKDNWVAPRAIVELLAAGRMSEGLAELQRFLTARAVPLRHAIRSSTISSERLAAALAFPIPSGLHRQLCKLALLSPKDPSSNNEEESPNAH